MTATLTNLVKVRLDSLSNTGLQKSIVARAAQFCDNRQLLLQMLPFNIVRASLPSTKTSILVGLHLSLQLIPSPRTHIMQCSINSHNVR